MRELDFPKAAQCQRRGVVPECKTPYVKACLSTQKCKDVRCEIQTHVQKEWEHRQTFERNVTTVDEDALLDTIYGIIFEKSAGAGRAGVAIPRQCEAPNLQAI